MKKLILIGAVAAVVCTAAVAVVMLTSDAEDDIDEIVDDIIEE